MTTPLAIETTKKYFDKLPIIKYNIFNTGKETFSFLCRKQYCKIVVKNHAAKC